MRVLIEFGLEWKNVQSSFEALVRKLKDGYVKFVALFDKFVYGEKVFTRIEAESSPNVGLGNVQIIALSHELIMIRILYPFYINLSGTDVRSEIWINAKWSQNTKNEKRLTFV